MNTSLDAGVLERFHVTGSGSARPPARRVAYADGAGATAHRPGIDIELSHWVPNATDPAYRADTSTEICLRFAARPSHDDIDLVVNDHADVDGILSVFALVHSDLAPEHADVLHRTGRPAPSDLSPDIVAGALAFVW